MKPQKEIMLQNTADGIVAHCLVNGQPDPEIVAVMGTHILPTPYIDADYMADAVREIRKLNPGYRVSSI